MTKKKAILLDLNMDSITSDVLFREAFKGFDVINWANPDERNADLSTVQYAVVWKPEPGLLARCKNLEVIFYGGAGVDYALKDPTLPDLPLARFVDPSLTNAMVEWVILQVLMHTRHQRAYTINQSKEIWQELPQHLARDFRVGLMGFGELGQACATVLLALGFEINAWSRTSKIMPGISCFTGEAQKNDFLRQTDILVSLLPLTPATSGILNSSLFEKLATDGPFNAPILINAGRGGSQVDLDIHDALNNGTLFAASLDVFEEEPLPRSHLLWKCDNLYITPHTAALSDPPSLAAQVSRQLERLEQGLPPEHLVDRSRGY